jgi:hypothetical protein
LAAAVAACLRVYEVLGGLQRRATPVDAAQVIKQRAGRAGLRQNENAVVILADEAKHLRAQGIP